MSLDIRVENAPQVTRMCPFCLEARSKLRRGAAVDVALDGEWFLSGDVPQERLEDVTCDPWCEGVIKEDHPGWPSANFSSANGRDLFEMLGVPYEDIGTITHAEIPGVLQRIMVVLSKDHVMIPYTSEDSVEGGVTHARVMTMGQTEDMIRRRVLLLRDILICAREQGRNVLWY